MGYSYPYITPYLICLLLLVIFQVCAKPAYSQTPVKDPSSHQQKAIITDSARSFSDSAIGSAKELFQFKKNQVSAGFKNRIRSVTQLPSVKGKHQQDSSHRNTQNPFRNLFPKKPALQFTGGYASYNFNYRSNTDTPFVEKDISQHNVTGRLNFTVAGILPFQVNYWLRRSNSSIFQDINDVQLSFSGSEFRNQLQAVIRQRLLSLTPNPIDSLTRKLYDSKKDQLAGKDNWLKNPFQLQHFIEANEILRVPRITYDPRLPDSTNARRSDSLQKAAALFLGLYKKAEQERRQLATAVDSLRKIVDANQRNLKKYRQLVNGDLQNITASGKWKKEMEEFGLGNVQIPAKYKWLTGIRNFSLGRSPLNYSALTAKNISINGVNFEYNSWYYFAVTAGLVNYRFRDFVISPFNRTPQYLYMARLGVGRLEHNYFILSAYRGQKQLSASSTSTAKLSSITVSGFSAEAKWQLHRTTWIAAEVATSISPDLFNNPPEASPGFNMHDKTNKAYALHIYSYLPKTNTRIEGMYKYTGARFQSFSNYLSNAAQQTWYVKGEQGFFKRRLRINASMRSNDFYNPYIIQHYKSNTVFKSLMATLRMRKWPVITIGYMPMSQLTVLGSQVVENKFQTLNASIFHQYKIKRVRVATSFVYNRFYNHNNDTGFVYYNATNMYLSQSFFFTAFTAGIATSYTRNSSYELKVLDGNVQLNLTRLGTLGFGVKINNMNSTLTKPGEYLNANIRINKRDIIYISYEKGYLPGYSKGLVRNDIGNVLFVKYFGR